MADTQTTAARPEQTSVYRYYDESDVLLYVGMSPDHLVQPIRGIS